MAKHEAKDQRGNLAFELQSDEPEIPATLDAVTWRIGNGDADVKDLGRLTKTAPTTFQRSLFARDHVNMVGTPG